ncbi:hypothetical protein [Pantoea vagans]|uniref:hypothetical protein n=1 Tax=Pantoea vagans TaxID=470934 RepID=UPI0030B8D7D7
MKRSFYLFELLNKGGSLSAEPVIGGNVIFLLIQPLLKLHRVHIRIEKIGLLLFALHERAPETKKPRQLARFRK